MEGKIMSKYRKILGNMQFIKAIIIEELIKNQILSSKELSNILTKEIGIDFQNSEVIQVMSLFPKEFELSGFDVTGSKWKLSNSVINKVGVLNENEN